MPVDITAVPTWSEVTDTPEDGDLAGASTGAAPVNPVLQKIANRDAYIVTSLNGVIVGRVEIYGINDGIWVGAFGLWLGGLFYTRVAGPLAVLTGLGVGVWHYLYAWINAGVVAVEVSTTAPGAASGYAFKGVTTTHRYLGCFYTTAADACRPFRTVNGRCTNLRGADAGSYVVATSDGVTAGWIAVGLTAWAPPHAAWWRFDLAFRARTAGLGAWEIRPQSQTLASHASASQSANFTGELLTPIEMSRYPAGNVAIDYRVTDPGPAGALPIVSFYFSGFGDGE